VDNTENTTVFTFYTYASELFITIGLKFDYNITEVSYQYIQEENKAEKELIIEKENKLI
jgi:hypothetical protein